MQVRGSQVSMGAEGGSNALSTENGCTFQNFSEFVLCFDTRTNMYLVPSIKYTLVVPSILQYMTAAARERSTVVHGP